MTLPIHIKVEFCRMLDRKDGAYGVVLCELFPPKKNKKIHQLVFITRNDNKNKVDNGRLAEIVPEVQQITRIFGCC